MTYTLAADGSSDEVLLPILTWSLKQQGATSVSAQWVDFGRIPRQSSMQEKLRTALDLYPCDILFVHRDAEGQPSELRRQQITEALVRSPVPHVPVVPVRMTEAWLLLDEMAIRSAAGNPNGREDLNLPDISFATAGSSDNQLHRRLLASPSPAGVCRPPAGYRRRVILNAMNRRQIILATGAGALALQAQQPPAPMAGKTHLKVGDSAPAFTKLRSTAGGDPVSLADFKGKNTVVLAFFPAAFTGG